MAPEHKTDELPFVSAELLPVDTGRSTRALPVDAAAPAPARSDVPAADARDPAIGSYQVLSRLGQGALGESYGCRDVELNREVVVKVLRPELAGDAAMRQRFVASARAMARADVPELVTVFHVGEHKGRPFFAVERLDGQDLQRRLDAGPLDLRSAVLLVERAATALDRLQRRGLHHGNLKPSNLFLCADQVRLADAGLAAVTTEQTVTSPYRAPELGEAGEATAPADVYALGAILFRCVVGEPPTAGTPAEGQLEGLPPPLADLLRHLLATDPATRFSSPAAAARALAGLGAALAPAPAAASAVDPAAPPPNTPAPWRQPRLQGAAAASALVVLGLVALLLRGPDWDARLVAGEAVQVRQEIEALPPAKRDAVDDLYLGHALDDLKVYDEAFRAYARAAARGAVDDRARDFVLGELDARRADDVIALLDRWPDASVDAPLVRLAEDGDRNQRRHALAALTLRGQQARVDLQKVGVRELEHGRSCDERKRGVQLLIDAGREPMALAAVQKARARGVENLCMQRELEQAERAIHKRLQAR